MKGVYTYSQDWCYGCVEGIFQADSDDVQFLVDTGAIIYFGEILGKYSDVEIKFENVEDFKLVSTDPHEMEILNKVAGLGYNPFYSDSYSFAKSDELNDLHDKLEKDEKYLDLEDFIKYVRDNNVIETIKAGKYYGE